MTIARLRIFWHTSTLDHNEKLYLFAVDFQIMIIILAVMVKLVTMVMLMTLVIKMMTMTM